VDTVHTGLPISPNEPMTSPAPEHPNEWHRLASVSSLVDVVSRHVEDLVQLSARDLPQWLTSLGVPTGWHLARMEGDNLQPSRIAVCIPTSGGGCACETISVFRFTGIPAVDVLHRHADCTLRDLDAENITTRRLTTPPVPAVAAVRCSGQFNTGGLSVRAQYSTYVAGSDIAGGGRLIQHGIFTEAATPSALAKDIEQLSNTVHHAFLTTVADMAGRRSALKSQHVQH
jgi:hypothetical protein